MQRCHSQCNTLLTFGTATFIIFATIFTTTPSHAASTNVAQPPPSKAVWNIVHAYNKSENGAKNKLTVQTLKQVVKDEGVNAVELDVVYHTDRFYAAHGYHECNPDEPRRAELCLELAPLLMEIESNPNITLLFFDPKSQSEWQNEESGATIYLSDMAAYIRQYIKTKAVWWGLGANRGLAHEDIDELIQDAPLPVTEGISMDYSVSLQDLYLRARRANVENVGFSRGNPNRPGSCFELNKALAYLAEGKISRVLSWTINDVATLINLYQSNGSRVVCEGGEGQLLGDVHGVISDMFTGIRNHDKVIKGDPTLRLANSTDVFWTPRTQFSGVVDAHSDNVLANGGAEMPPLPNSFASSWRLEHSDGAGALSISEQDCPTVTPSSGTRYFALRARCDLETRMYQDIPVEAYRSEIDGGDVAVTVSADVFLNRLGVDATIGVEDISSGSEIARFDVLSSSNDTSSAGKAQGGWVRINGTAQLPPGARTVRVFVSVPASCGSTPSLGCPDNHLFIDNIAFTIYVDEQDKMATWSRLATAILLSVTGAAVIAVVLIVLAMQLRGSSKLVNSHQPHTETADPAAASDPYFTAHQDCEEMKGSVAIPIANEVRCPRDNHDVSPHNTSGSSSSTPLSPVLVLVSPSIAVIEIEEDQQQPSPQESVFSDAASS